MSAGLGFHRATARGEGGIAIVELYGDARAFIAKHVRLRRGLPPPGRAALGEIVDDRGEAIDDVVCSSVAAEEAWSRLANVTLSLHGGPLITRRVEELLERAGAMPWSRRDVLRRAVDEGALDAVRATAYERLVEARTERAAIFFARHYEGALSQEIASLIDEIERRGSRALEGVRIRLARLVSRAESARRLSDPLRLLIAGRPNAGKSTLLNALVGRERVVVSASIGTTRDLVAAEVSIEGFPVEVIDSAGIHDLPSDAVEAEAIARAREASADAVLWLRAPPWEISPEEIAFLARFPEPLRWIADNFLDLFAVDRPSRGETHAEERKGDVAISAKRGDGLDDLSAMIAKRALEAPDGPIEELPAPFLPGQRRVLESALEAANDGASGGLDALRERLILCVRSVWD